MEFPGKKYGIIYADPPWHYRDKASSGKRGVCFKYEVQSHDWVCNLPVKTISDTDCILFLWITMPKLNEVMEVIESWGFKYKTCAFTWVKKNRKKPTWFMGMGSWTRANTELCLLATKGNPRRVSASVLSVIDSPLERHSKKPDIIRDKIVELCGDLPRIELFAREKVPDWDYWGNDVGVSSAP